MRRLTLILSDLYLPSEIGPGEVVRDASIPTALELPNLDWLLRFARVTGIPDWRRALAAELGLPALADIPLAQLVAGSRLSPETAASVWLATPVRFEARLDHVRLADRGLLRIAASDRAAWCAAFAASFAPDYVLHEDGERGFLLSGLAAANVTTVDPARLLDSDVAAALPRGADAGDLRRLGAEIEMWLHSASLNDARERARQPRVSAFWLWGGGARSPLPIREALPHRHASVALYGADPFLAALAQATNENPAAPPANLSAADPNAAHVIVELAPMSGGRHESLAVLDAQWFAPARAALASGALATLDLVANDHWFRIAARPGWRFWRRRRPWLESLRRRAASGSA